MRKLIIILTLLLPFQAQAQNAGMSVLEIFDQYVVSKGAALVCLKADPALDAKYDENFAVVYQKAWERLRQLKQSDVSNDQITDTLDNRIKVMHQKVASDVPSNGCDSKAYKELTNLYKYHAIWNPFAGSN